MSLPSGPLSSSGAGSGSAASSWAGSPPLSNMTTSPSTTTGARNMPSPPTNLDPACSRSPSTSTTATHSTSSPPDTLDTVRSPESAAPLSEGGCWNKIEKLVFEARNKAPHDPTPESSAAPGHDLIGSLSPTPAGDDASAQELFDHCRYSAALSKRLEALHLLRGGSSAPDCPAIIRALNDVGLVLDRLGMYGKALQRFDEAYKMALGMYGVNNELVAAALVNSGNSLCKQGSYDEALQVLREALRINRAVLGDEDCEVANNLNSIGAVLESQGKRAVALDRYRVALCIMRRVHHEEGGHVDIAMCLENVASVLLDDGRPHEALRSLEEALEIRSGTQSRDHEDIANTLSSIGSARLQAGRDPEIALRNFRNAHRIFHKVCAHEGGHEGFAAALVGVGQALSVQGRHDEALVVFEEAVCMLDKTVGSMHPHTATVNRNVAGELLLLKRYGEAVERCAGALDVFLARLDCEGVEVGHTQYLLALCCSARGEAERAKGLFQKCSKVFLKEYGVNSPLFKFSIDSFLSLAASGEALILLPVAGVKVLVDTSLGWEVRKHT